MNSLPRTATLFALFTVAACSADHGPDRTPVASTETARLQRAPISFADENGIPLANDLAAVQSVPIPGVQTSVVPFEAGTYHDGQFGPGDEPRDPVVPNAGLSQGAWSEAVTIDVPASPQGIAPELRIVADHHVKDGPLGSGQRLVVGSVISRHSSTGGVPNLTVTDSYRLDGQRLVLEDGNVYRTERPDGARLVYDDDGNTWTLEQDGWVSVYGSNLVLTGKNATKKLYDYYGRSQNDSGELHQNDGNFASVFRDEQCLRGDVLCNTVEWYLSKRTDPFGNEVVYDYEIEPLPAELPSAGGYWFGNSRNHRLAGISYQGARIAFEYARRPDARLDVSSGSPTFMGERLVGIESRRGTRLHSRYELSYLDEDPEDCAGEPRSTVYPVVQSLLKRITRVSDGAAGPGSRRQLRCFEHATSNNEDAWLSATNISSRFEDVTPSAGWDFERHRVIAVPLNIDGDSRSDLVVLRVTCAPGGSTCSVNVQARESRSNGVFVSTLRSSAWASSIAEHLDGDHFHDQRGHAFVDLDRDGWVELLWSEDEDSIHMLQYDPYAGRLESRVALFEPGIGGALDRGFFADVNGDGVGDLIEPARMRWFPIRLVGPNFGAQLLLSDPLALDLPVATLKDELGDVVPPLHVNPDWETSADEYLRSQIRFGDVNGDGLVDIAVSLFARWEEHPDCENNALLCRFHPDVESLYSEIWFGDGYGYFIRSGLSAGPPALLELPGEADTRNRTWVTTFALQDLDRSGYPELLASRAAAGGSMSMWASRFRGLHEGFAFAREDIHFEYETRLNGTQQHGYAIDVPNDYALGVDYTGGGDVCFEKSVVPVFADFDGDGFAERLTVEAATDPAQTDCNTTFCVTYAENRRTHSRGRITSSKNEWGGTTSLGWGFSGSALHDNPDLPNNVEVLERVVGSEGEVQLRYGRGALSRHAGFTGFGLIERKNPRGGVDAFAYNTVPALSGLPLYSARYRTSGELERLTVFVHGRTVSGKALELELLPDSDAPAYNPLIRQCDYELALQSSESVGDLIHHCFGLDRSVSRKPSKSSILAASGLWRHPPGAPSFEGDDAPFQLAAVAWGDVAAVTSIQLSNLEQTNSPDGKFVLGRLTPSVQSVDWRKPLPQNAAAPPAPLLGTGYLSHRPPAMAKVDTTAYVVDRAFDHDTLKPIEEVAWRDLSTTGDDLVTRYDWEEHPDHPGAHRLRSQATVDASGAAIRARTVAAFAAQGFDRPAEVQRCGSDPGACVSERYSWFENGDLRAHTDAAGATTRWLAEDACGDRTLVDPLGRRRELRRDSLCRLSRETWLARTTSMTYDGFGRVETRLDEPGAGEPAKLTRTYWNDPLLDDESAPRFCTTDEAGKRVVVHLDDFGRETRRDTCWQENAVVPPLPGARTPKAPVGNLPALGCGCAPGSAVSRLTAYGTDGKVMGTSAPHYASGEQPVFERVARDGAGREIVLVSPAPVTGGRPAWVTERTFFAPSLEESKDALGVTSSRRTSTLRHEKRRADRMVESSEQNAAGWITSSTGPDGVAIAIEHDPFGRPSRTRTVEMGSCLDRSGRPGASCTRSEQARYDAVGRLVWKARADGTRVEYSYDGVGRPLTEEQSSSSGVQRVVSRAWSYGRDAEQRPWVRITDDTGAWTNTTVDGLGRTVLESDSYGIRKTIDYAGASGRSEVRSQVNDGTFAGEWVTVTDASGRVVATTAPESGTTRYRHNGRGQVVSETDADGVERSYSYLLNGALEEETLGGYTVASFKYDEAGRVVREVRDGVVNARTYDALGRVESITTGEPSQDVLRLQYDGVSERVLVETKTAGSERASTSYSYDAWGRLSSVTDPAGHVEHYTYDAADRLRLHTDAEGYERETRYDYRGRIVYQEGNGPDFTTYTYGVLPKLRLTGAPSVEVEHVRTVAATNAQGRTSTTFTDARGRLWATLRPDGTRTENVFDGSRPSETLSVDAHGTRTASTALIYDAETGREVGTLGPYTPESRPDERYRVDRTLSRAGRLLSLDAAGEGTSFEYGSDHGLLVAERYHGLERRLERAKPARGVSSVVVAEALHRQDGLGLARSTRFARDPAGRLAEVVVKLGSDVQTTRYRDRDLYGQPRQTVAETTREGVTDTVETRFSYGPDGRVKDRSLQINGRAAGRTAWEFFDNGVLKRVISPAGREVLYEYGSPFDHTLDAVVAGGTELARVTSRDAAGRVTELERSGSLISVDYDAMGRPTNRKEAPIAKPSSVQESYTTRYDSLGRLVQEEHYDGKATWTNTYAYDGGGRLTKETHGKSGVTFTYEVDVAGRRRSTRRSDGAGETTTALNWDGDVLVDVGGRPLEYDDFGAVAVDQRGTVLASDPAGRLVALTRGETSVRVLRDAEGLPVARFDGASQTVTHWDLDPSGLPVELTMPGGNSLSYVTGPELVQRMTDTTQPSAEGMVDRNAVGTPISIGSSSIDEGSAFGAELGSSPERFAYAGMERIEGLDGLLLARHRGYDPETGRFLSLDPLGLDGGNHRTLYALGNPVSYRDPMGLSPECDDPATISGAIQLNDPGLTKHQGTAELLPWIPPEFMQESPIDAANRGDPGLGNWLPGTFDFSGTDLPTDPCPYSGCEPPGGGEEGMPPFGTAGPDVVVVGYDYENDEYITETVNRPLTPEGARAAYASNAKASDDRSHGKQFRPFRSLGKLFQKAGDSLKVRMVKLFGGTLSYWDEKQDAFIVHHFRSWFSRGGSAAPTTAAPSSPPTLAQRLAQNASSIVQCMAGSGGQCMQGPFVVGNPWHLSNYLNIPRYYSPDGTVLFLELGTSWGNGTNGGGLASGVYVDLRSSHGIHQIGVYSKVSTNSGLAGVGTGLVAGYEQSSSFPGLSQGNGIDIVFASAERSGTPANPTGASVAVHSPLESFRRLVSGGVTMGSYTFQEATTITPILQIP